MSDREKKKHRTEFRKNRLPRARQNDLTRDFHREGEEHYDECARGERLSGKGNYQSITYTVEAQSRAQLDAIYRELTASGIVLVAL